MIDIKQFAVEAVAQHYPNSHLIFITGSHAQGRATAHSDLDIVVFTKQPGTAYEQFTYKSQQIDLFKLCLYQIPEFIYYALSHQHATYLGLLSHAIPVQGSPGLAHALSHCVATLVKTSRQPYAATDLEKHHRLVAKHLDDLLQAEATQQPIYNLHILNDLSSQFSSCLLIQSGAMLSSGKWLGRSLEAMFPGINQQMREASIEALSQGSTKSWQQLVGTYLQAADKPAEPVLYRAEGIRGIELIRAGVPSGWVLYTAADVILLQPQQQGAQMPGTWQLTPASSSLLRQALPGEGFLQSYAAASVRLHAQYSSLSQTLEADDEADFLLFVLLADCILYAFGQHVSEHKALPGLLTEFVTQGEPVSGAEALTVQINQARQIIAKHFEEEVAALQTQLRQEFAFLSTPTDQAKTDPLWFELLQLGPDQTQQAQAFWHSYYRLQELVELMGYQKAWLRAL